MSVRTVADVIKSLQNNYHPDTELVITWWDVTDVENNFGDFVTKNEAGEVWNDTNEMLDYALDNFIGSINDQWSNDVYRYLDEKKSDAKQAEETTEEVVAPNAERFWDLNIYFRETEPDVWEDTLTINPVVYTTNLDTKASFNNYTLAYIKCTSEETAIIRAKSGYEDTDYTDSLDAFMTYAPQRIADILKKLPDPYTVTLRQIENLTLGDLA